MGDAKRRGEMMNKPPNPTCLDCRFFTVTPGYDGFYPGETTPIDIGCQKQIWRLDTDSTQEAFTEYMRTAIECDKFEPCETLPNSRRPA